jgi:hypothetical protein
MKFLAAFNALLVGCVSASTSSTYPNDRVCNTVVDPHTCVYNTDEYMYAAHGGNRCEALRKIEKKLYESGSSSHIDLHKVLCRRSYE